MSDSFSVTTSQSWFSRVGKAFVGVLVGLATVAAAFPLLWWNEGRAVHRARSLAEGAAIVVDTPADAVSPALDGKLVHVTALATTDATLTDPDLGIAAQAIRLRRSAETYQWTEDRSTKKRKKLGGGEETTTTYTYKKTWTGRHLDSAEFHNPSGHENPPSLAWESKTIEAERVAFGAFTLPPDLVAKIDDTSARQPQPADEEAMRVQGFRPAEPGTFFKGRNVSDPQIGDVRIRFEVTLPQTVSIVAVQRGSSFESYQAEAGSSILLLEHGSVPAAQMFKSAQTANTITTWLVRAGGFLLMFIGFVVVLRPIAVLGSVLPFLGSILGAGTGFVAFLLALILSLTTIALAWLFYRPLLGGGLLVAAVAALVLLVRRRKPKAVVPPPIPPPVMPPPIPQV
jgi:hypothetical protein